MAPVLNDACLSMDRLSSANIEHLLKQAVVQVCSNVVPYGRELLIEGTISVTADSQEVCAVLLEEKMLVPGLDMKAEPEEEDEEVAGNGEGGNLLNHVQYDGIDKTDNTTSVVQSYLKAALRVWYNEDSLGGLRNSESRQLCLTPQISPKSYKENNCENSKNRNVLLPKSEQANSCYLGKEEKRKKKKHASGAVGRFTSNISASSALTTMSSAVSDNRSSHQSSDHFSNPLDCNIKRMFACEICNIEFSFATNLTRHQRKFHGRPCRRKLREEKTGTYSSNNNNIINLSNTSLQDISAQRNPLSYSQLTDLSTMQNQQPIESSVMSKDRFHDNENHSPRSNNEYSDQNVGSSVVCSQKSKRKRSLPRKLIHSADESGDQDKPLADDVLNSPEDNREVQPHIQSVSKREISDIGEGHLKENVVPIERCQQPSFLDSKVTLVDESDMVCVDLRTRIAKKPSSSIPFDSFPLSIDEKQDSPNDLEPGNICKAGKSDDTHDQVNEVQDLSMKNKKPVTLTDLDIQIETECASDLSGSKNTSESSSSHSQADLSVHSRDSSPCNADSKIQPQSSPLSPSNPEITKTSPSVHQSRRYTNSNAPGKYTCKTCHKVFTFSTNLTRHQRNTHGRPLKRKSKEQAMGERDLFSCEICYKEFMFETYLIRHLKIAHGKLLPDDFDDNFDVAALQMEDADDLSGCSDISKSISTANGEPPPHIEADGNPDQQNVTDDKIIDLSRSESDQSFNSADISVNLVKRQDPGDDLSKSVITSVENSKQEGSERDKSVQQMYPCPVCGRQFSFMSNLIRHMKNLHYIVANRKQARMLMAQGSTSKSEQQKLMKQFGFDKMREDGKGHDMIIRNGHLSIKEEPSD